MPNYIVLDGDWLEAAIREAERLRDQAQSSGKPVAIAAAGIRLESLRDIRCRSSPALPPGEGPITLSIADRPHQP